MSSSTEFAHTLKNYMAIIVGYSELLLEELGDADPKCPDVVEIKRAAVAALAFIDGHEASLRKLAIHPGAHSRNGSPKDRRNGRR